MRAISNLYKEYLENYIKKNQIFFNKPVGAGPVSSLNVKVGASTTTTTTSETC